jgi:hypothetical protein
MIRARLVTGVAGVAAAVRRLARGALVSTLAVIVLPARTAQAQYTFTPIGVPGASATAAFRVNNSGQVVGFYVAAAGDLQGFLSSGGAYTTIHGTLPCRPFRGA